MWHGHLAEWGAHGGLSSQGGQEVFHGTMALLFAQSLRKIQPHISIFMVVPRFFSPTQTQNEGILFT